MNTIEDEFIAITTFQDFAACGDESWDPETASYESSSSQSSPEPSGGQYSPDTPITGPVNFDSAAISESTDLLWYPFPDFIPCEHQEYWSNEFSLPGWNSNPCHLDLLSISPPSNLASESSLSSISCTFPCEYQSTYPIPQMDTVNASGSMTRISSHAQTDYASSDAASELSTEGSPTLSLSSCPGNGHICSQCNQHFSRVAEMEDHAREAKHKPFACSQCSRLFSRQDALTRHRGIHKSQKRYPCEHCEKYRGQDAFKRRDHLRQHLRKKHRVHPNSEFPRYCRYEMCSSSACRGNFDGFRSRREYSRHMRDSHGEEKHDCEVDGCDRVGRKGFARLSDLDRHRKSVHENEIKVEDCH